ncbi:hypothetical protein BDA99DRAFT_492474 [Phascolomyces articulosus]|uniref:DH domain-containing protein n=1 Tax=Phascolomyces articulosus TaxID=60185 RepID=A0AAD5KRI8_9FUNG|nr:hypothetical protein BDA99DRAFT_492474 [Phascolomyces articulosus]
MGTNPIIMSNNNNNNQQQQQGSRVGESRPTTASSMGDMDEEEYQLSKQTMRRNHAIHELFETERDYVADLGRLVEVYFDVLARQDWIPFQHKQTIFRNASDLLSFHRLFFATLDPDNEVNHSHAHDEPQKDIGGHIAKTFLKMGDHFIMYTQYCDLHDEAWALCEEYRDRPEWSQFTKESMALITTTDGSTVVPVATSSVVSGSIMMDQPSSMSHQQQPQLASSVSSSPIGKKLQFEDYLIKPVQRICRYQLLLKEIIRYTPNDTQSYTLLTNAMHLIRETVAEIDRLKNVKDISKRTERFVQRFDGDWRINKRHVVKLGNVLISGAIEVTYTALGQSVAKPRYMGCFVFPTYLILVRPKKVTTYEPKHWFPLRLAELEDLSDIEGQREHAFVVRCKKHTFAFSATCNQEKQLWLKHLEQAIDTAKNDESRDELIVPSLSGIAATSNKQSQQQQQRQSNVRLSRSFTNILDMKLSSSPSSSGGGNNNDNQSSGSASTSSNNNITSMPIKLKRSISTSVQLNDIITNDISAIKDTTSPPPPATRLQKRYSADYPATRRKELLKSRTNSDITRKRPGSLDMLSSTPIMTPTPSTPTNMIGKMSMQIKSNHQNALRVAVDHKLHAVCTQDYLSSRATWYLRERENSTVDLRKRKSMPFMRSSASSFSIMSPSRRISEQPQPQPIPQQLQSNDFDVQSTVSSITSTAAGTAVASTIATVTPATMGGDGSSSDMLKSSYNNNHRSSSQRRTLTHSASDFYSMSPSSSPFVDVKSEYIHPTSNIPSTTTTAIHHSSSQPQPRLAIDTTNADPPHSNNSNFSRRTSSPAPPTTSTATTPNSLFSGRMDRSFSTLSMQPFKKNALMDRMFNKLSNLSKKASITRSQSRMPYHSRNTGQHYHHQHHDDNDIEEYEEDYDGDEGDYHDAGSQCTGGDYTSDMNSYIASEMGESRQDSMSHVSLRRYRSTATDQGGQRRQRRRSSHNKGPIFRWIRSESGVSTSKRTYNQDLNSTNGNNNNYHQHLDRPPVAFAYASTPAVDESQQYQQGRTNHWKRKFSTKKMSSSIGGNATTTSPSTAHYLHKNKGSSMHF